MSKSYSEQSNAGSGGSKRRSYSEKFRRDVVRLVTDEGYSIPAAAKACGVSEPTVPIRCVPLIGRRMLPASLVGD